MCGGRVGCEQDLRDNLKVLQCRDGVEDLLGNKPPRLNNLYPLIVLVPIQSLRTKVQLFRVVKNLGRACGKCSDNLLTTGAIWRSTLIYVVEVEA